MTVLTVSGNEITDAVRAANVQGDGRGYEVVSNGVPNGGFESNANYWYAFGGAPVATVTRDTTEKKLGAASGKIVSNAAGAGIAQAPPMPAAAVGQTWTVSFWVKGPPGEIVGVYIATLDAADAGLGLFAFKTTTLTGSWQRVTSTGRVVEATTAKVRVVIDNRSAASAFTFYVDGIQLEVGSFAHDYVETDGALVTALLGTPDSSFGIWEATTNQCINGGFETGTTGGWGGAGATIARTTALAKFGTACLQVTMSGTSGGGVYFVPGVPIAAAPGQTWTGSAWWKAPVGTSMQLTLIPYAGGTALTASQAQTTRIATGDWQRLTATLLSAPATTDRLIVTNYVNGHPAGLVYYIDSVQIEQKPVATPYVETNGAAATRNAARVQAPATVLDETQGWIAARVRLGWATTDAISPTLFAWRDSATDRIVAYWDAAKKWALVRVAGGASTTVTSPVQTFGAATTQTAVFAWTATEVKVSVDGNPFTTVANVNVPALAATLADIGTNNGVFQIQGDVLWFAAGTGTLTDADAAQFHSFGDKDPRL